MRAPTIRTQTSATTLYVRIGPWAGIPDLAILSRGVWTGGADARMLGADVAARGAALAVRVPLGARQRRDRRAGGSGPSRARRRARRLGPLAPARGGRRGRGGRVPARGDPRLPRLQCRAPRAAPGAPGRDPAGRDADGHGCQP